MALDAEGALAGVAGLVSICIGNTPAVDVDVYGAIRRVAQIWPDDIPQEVCKARYPCHE